MKRILCIAIVALITSATMAQDKPQWTYDTPKAGNSTYLFICEQGIGYSQEGAYNIALTRVFQSTANRIGQPFDSQKLEAALRNGTSLEVISSTYNIPINKVCEYSEQLNNGTYRVYVLCQVAASGNITPQWEPFSNCSGGEIGNGISLLKSIFVPGLGQMGKGHVTEGVITLIGEVALVGGAVGCYYMAQDKLNVMRDPSTSYSDWNAAQNDYNTLRTTSYIAWGTAAVLYVFNLIRAVSATPRYGDGLAFAPTLMPTNFGITPGVSFSINL